MKKSNISINILSSLILQITSVICGFLLQKKIVVTYGSDINGLITLITRSLKYIIVFEAGFSLVVKSLLYKPIAENKHNSICKILCACEKFYKRLSYIFLIYMILLSLFLPLLTNINYDHLFMTSLIFVIGVSIFAEYYLETTYTILLNTEQKVYIISIIQIISNIINVLLCIILINNNLDIRLIKLCTAVIFIIKPLFINSYVRKKYNIHFDDKSKEYAISHKYKGLAHHIAYILHENIDILLLTFYSTVAEISVYSIYMLIINSIRNLIRSALNGVEPFFGNVFVSNDKEYLRNSFRKYERLYYILCTVVFSVTFCSLIPFVTIYTKGITDVDYIRPIFGYIITISMFIFVLRYPYYDLIKSAGMFNSTKKGAIIEVLINMVLSILLINRYGIVGVAIGTLISVLIRTFEIIIYTNKRILNNNMIDTILLIIKSFIAFMLVIFISKYIMINITSYFMWILKTFELFIISIIIVVLFNYGNKIKIK